MGKKGDPMEELYTEELQFDRHRLVQKLKQYLGIDPNDGSPVVRPAFHELDDDQKVIAQLLYARAAFELDEIDESDIPQDIYDVAQVVGLTESRADKIAVDLDFVKGENDPHGPYFVPPSRIDEAADHL